MIEFFYQHNFKELDLFVYTKWLHEVAASESQTIGSLSYVFCSDDYLLKINQEHLNHDFYTDVITFDYNMDGLIHGEVYISTDRVMDNAARFRESETDELIRVMVHALLHLCGYRDKTEVEAATMREKENDKMKMFHVKQ
jgi:rRNA maturation RNase YbeY